jgi:hypothetical protein
LCGSSCGCALGVLEGGTAGRCSIKNWKTAFKVDATACFLLSALAFENISPSHRNFDTMLVTTAVCRYIARGLSVLKGDLLLATLVYHDYVRLKHV